MEAEAVSSDTVRPQRNNLAPLSPGASADQDMREIVATVEKARKAASNAAQVWKGGGCDHTFSEGLLATSN